MRPFLPSGEATCATRSYSRIMRGPDCFPVHVHKPALSQAAEVGVKWKVQLDAGRATSEPLDAHGSNARSRSRRGNSLANHFFIFKAAPSKVVTMACISPSLVM